MPGPRRLVTYAASAASVTVTSTLSTAYALVVTLPSVPGTAVRHATAGALARVEEVLAGTIGPLAAESLATLRALRVLLHQLAEAVEEGLVEEMRQGMADMARAVALMEQVADQMEQALPVLDATAPTLGMVNGTLAQLNATVAQVEALPGMRIARRLVSRPSEIT